MKKNIFYLCLSLLLIHCTIFFFPTTVLADGAQVSVPGRITFETDSIGTVTTKESNSSNQKEYAYLPKTGEMKQEGLVLGSVLVGLFLVVMAIRKKVTKNE